MKKIFLYFCLLTTQIGISQNIKLVNDKDIEGINDNTYAYNNDIDKFTGEWIYTNKDEVFKMTLVKVKLNLSKVLKIGVNSFSDKIVFYYDYRKNNKIIISNYDSLKQRKPDPNDHKIFNKNIFMCQGSITNPNVLRCFTNDILKRHSNTLDLTFKNDSNTLTSKNSYGSGGVSIISSESERCISGFTFPDNMTLKKVK